ncbi:MAG TPA: guanylate kinase [Thermodesulfovibrionales bacterium]|jgi:guanylate kinase|nr:guanylate kinase [Thermodesulfovibrionales bacterium]
MRKRKGSLFIVSAPSGAGKTTLCRELTAVLPDIRHSVSYTTRPPRKGEADNRDYTFVKEEEFRRMIREGAFVEWAVVHGNLYGTSRQRLEEMRKEGIDVILDIDTQGARQLRLNYRDGLYIFVLPPSLDVLKKRLDDRMSNAPDDIKLRMKRAVEEIREYKNYDYVIVNDILAEALSELKAIVLAERVKRENIDPEWVETFAV